MDELENTPLLGSEREREVVRVSYRWMNKREPSATEINQVLMAVDRTYPVTLTTAISRVEHRSTRECSDYACPRCDLDEVVKRYKL